MLASTFKLDERCMVPFLKWAGGKRWLFNEQFIMRLPTFNRYIEPFLGSAAGFFKLAPENSLLSDVNEDLINLFRVIRDSPLRLSRAMGKLQSYHSQELYYRIRANEPKSEFSRAVRMLYLNRSCWNGLYRVNTQGKFNVPIGTKTNFILPTDDFARASEMLKKAKLECRDFEVAIDEAQRGDLVFLDPPYTVKHNMNGFVKYNENLFSWDDQTRLRNAALRAAHRGANVIVTNANHESVKNLYAGLGSFEVSCRHSVIAGSARARAATSELVIWL